MSTTSKLSPTVFMPSPGDGQPAGHDAAVRAPFPAPLADAAPGPEYDLDRITGITLTFACVPLGGATPAHGFEPFALP